jgi:hypothetical protein
MGADLVAGGVGLVQITDQGGDLVGGAAEPDRGLAGRMPGPV